MEYTGTSEHISHDGIYMGCGVSCYGYVHGKFCTFHRIMDEESARGATKSWQVVLKEYDTVSSGGVSTWYFHQAAMESLLCFHSVNCVVGSEPVKSQR